MRKYFNKNFSLVLASATACFLSSCGSNSITGKVTDSNQLNSVVVPDNSVNVNTSWGTYNQKISDGTKQQGALITNADQAILVRVVPQIPTGAATGDLYTKCQKTKIVAYYPGSGEIIASAVTSTLRISGSSAPCAMTMGDEKDQETFRFTLPPNHGNFAIGVQGFSTDLNCQIYFSGAVLYKGIKKFMNNASGTVTGSGTSYSCVDSQISNYANQYPYSGSLNWLQMTYGCSGGTQCTNSNMHTFNTNVANTYAKSACNESAAAVQAHCGMSQAPTSALVSGQIFIALE